jgi:hypothetical protein
MIKYKLKLIIILFVFFNFSLQAQNNQPVSKELYPRYFRNLVYLGVSGGVSGADLSDFNLWSRANDYPDAKGNFGSIGLEMAFATNKGIIGGFEWISNLRNTSMISPNMSSNLMIRVGYNVRTFNKLDLNITGGIGFSRSNIRFNKLDFSNYELPFVLQDIAATQGYDERDAYLRRSGITFSPEIGLHYVFVRKGYAWQDERAMIFLKTGLMINSMTGLWRYGMLFDDGEGGTYFDSVTVENLNMPNVLNTQFYVRFGLAYKLSFD